jgi:hypothetical protein
LVLVLGLAAEALALAVVRAAFAATAKLHLEALVVCFGFGYLDKHLVILVKRDELLEV